MPFNGKTLMKTPSCLIISFSKEIIHSKMDEQHHINYQQQLERLKRKLDDGEIDIDEYGQEYGKIFVKLSMQAGLFCCKKQCDDFILSLLCSNMFTSSYCSSFK